MKATSPTWRILIDTRSPWLVEFAGALSETVPTRIFSPTISAYGRFKRNGAGPINRGAYTVCEFPLQRGYFSPHLSNFLFEDGRILSRLIEGGIGPNDPLICCLPHYVRIAERWSGPVIYYTTDLFRSYAGWNSKYIDALERQICRRATVVCPNSTRIADVLVRESGCDPNRILVLPNAVREENLLPAPALHPAPLPHDVEDLQRPVAGVIGNLAENTDWILLENAVLSTPWLSWLFVGPYTGAIADPQHAAARERLLAMGGRIRFAGARAYGDLKHYARSIDVAILPYRKREPTYSGSSTRFYEHLAACRPMIATDGFEELLHKEPLLLIAQSADQIVAILEDLRGQDFHDCQEEARWAQSLKETWETRARCMMGRTAERCLR